MGEELQRSVDSWCVHKMKCIKVYFVVCIQNASFLHPIEESIIGMRTTCEHITPKSLDPLVVNASSCYMTPSVWPPVGMV